MGLCAGGCSAAEPGDGGTGPDGGDPSDGGATSDASSDTSGDVDLGPIDAPGAPPGGIAREVCDGKDNDGNGASDDVDVGGDGICDCLSIGTVGSPGTWGAGDVFSTWLDERSPLPAVRLANGTLTSDALRSLDVVVVLRVGTQPHKDEPAHHAFEPAEVAALEQWVRAGGGLLTLVGFASNETENVNRLLAPYDLSYDPNSYVSGFVQDWLDHPVAAGVTKIKMENGLAPAGSTATIVARQGAGTAGLAATADRGRVLVWGDEWITYSSEWTDSTQQVERLWLNMLKWLSPPQRCQVPLPPHVK